jgi:hypothetical protein
MKEQLTLEYTLERESSERQVMTLLQGSQDTRWSVGIIC